MTRVEVSVNRLPHGQGLDLPAYQTIGSAGMDLAAANFEPIEIAPGSRALIPTGFRFAIPAGYEAQIRPRSGLALHAGVTVSNAPGTIDSDYRGEVSVVLINHGDDLFVVKRGDRIAQMVLAQVPRAELRETGDLPPTPRGAGAYGSTGTGANEA